MNPSTKAQGNWNGGHPKTADRTMPKGGRKLSPAGALQNLLGTHKHAVRRWGGYERLARMTPDARAIMAGPALAERMELWDWEAHK